MPTTADVDFGLVDKNGTFHYLKGENGIFSKNIGITVSGTYTFAVRNNSDVIISIPMKGEVNSLNASVAAAILIYGIGEK